MALPNLIIGGAPKSGTSSLYFWLSAHPECCASWMKETFYFADDVNRFNAKSNFVENGLSDYESHFKSCSNEKLIFEATAPYIYFKNALEQIPKLESAPKVIFILREPAARLYSKFKFNKFKLKNFHGTFKEYISLDGSLGSGRHYDEGQYEDYLSKWNEALGEERIGVYLFEDMIKDKTAFMKSVAEFLDIDPEFYNDFDFFKRNETVKLKSTKLHKLGLKIQPLIPVWVQEKIIPMYMSLNSGKMPKKTQEEAELVKELKEKYKTSNKELAILFPNLDLKAWN